MSIRSKDRVRRQLSTEGRIETKEEPIALSMVVTIWSLPGGFGVAMVTVLYFFRLDALTVGIWKHSIRREEGDKVGGGRDGVDNIVPILLW